MRECTRSSLRISHAPGNIRETLLAFIFIIFIIYYLLFNFPVSQCSERFALPPGVSSAAFFGQNKLLAERTATATLNTSHSDIAGDHQPRCAVWLSRQTPSMIGKSPMTATMPHRLPHTLPMLFQLIQL